MLQRKQLKYILLALAIFALPALYNACSESSPDGGSEEANAAESVYGQVRFEKIQHGGMERSYRYYAPAGMQANRPLVVLLHGHYGSSDLMIGPKSTSPYLRWVGLADENDFMLVALDGARGSDNAQGWNDCRAESNSNPDTDDRGFITTVMDNLAARFKIDKKRIYVVGSSNGGFMAQRMVAEAPNKIAAAAAFISSAPIVSECPLPSVKKAMMFINGVADPICPYAGGTISGDRGDIYPIESVVQAWIALNQISNVAEVTNFPDTPAADSSSTVTQYSYDKDSNYQVVLIKVNGGGHSEPSTTLFYSAIYNLVAGPQNKDLESADLVWEFLKDKSL